LAFTLLALALTGPIPAVLARAAWPMRAPRAAIVLWQAIAMAAVLSAFSAGLAIASPLLLRGGAWPGAGGATAADWALWLVSLAVFGVTLVIGARLITAVLAVAIGTRRRRARHRMVVDLLGKCRHGLGDVRVLAVDEPLAYCLPGIRGMVVLSEGALATLSAAEVSAILRHERTHLRARHDLVLEAFIAVHTAFPRLVRSGSALHAVRLLVELLADDAAVRAAGPGPLARALVAAGILIVLSAAGTAIGGVLRLRWLTQELTDDSEETLVRMLSIRDAKSRFLSAALVLFVTGFACYCVAIALMLLSTTPVP
jgi:Zn-dependent protease with chaperone function